MPLSQPIYSFCQSITRQGTGLQAWFRMGGNNIRGLSPPEYLAVLEYFTG